MIGLILIYFIGRSFYTLAFDHNKSKWGFAVLGVVSYYAGTIIGGIVLEIIGLIISSKFVYDLNNIVLSLLAMPFGLLICWGFYKILEKNWSKKTTVPSNDSLDGDLIDKF